MSLVVRKFSTVAPAFTLALAPTAVVADGLPREQMFFGKCAFTVDRPHWSKGAGSVIYKVRVKCPVAAEVRIKGELGFVSGGNSSTPAQGPGKSFYLRMKLGRSLGVRSQPSAFLGLMVDPMLKAEHVSPARRRLL